jgi:hypothetical protein
MWRALISPLQMEASDEDSTMKLRTPTSSQASSMRWPLFSRMNLTSPAAKGSHDSVHLVSNVKAPEASPPPPEYHAFTADLAPHFPQPDSPSPSLRDGGGRAMVSRDVQLSGRISASVTVLGVLHVSNVL